ncbi:PREDICTED: clustered mitochondria protein homolog [Acropora digitifera]|uniref:clustered mitochondria protein homolog n=1 Tax=Acropora digitifera TaxID=70779 RepID=UPI00077B09E2|nr:PREDICTED: clustered mitochondria protein homolog [Acropora digitifera]
MKEFHGDHPDTAACFHSLARVYIKIKDKTSAVEALRVSAQMNSKVLGEHKSTASSYYLLGALLFEKGDLQEAEEALKEASQLKKKLLSDSHPDSIESLQLLNDVRVALAAAKHP